jgi:WD40 repeat protein
VVKYSPDGRKIASGSDDNTVRLWNVASGTCLAVIHGFTEEVTIIAWDPMSNSDRFVTGAGDGSVRSWQVVESEHQCDVYLRWTSLQNALVVGGASIQGVKGLSQLNRLVLKQRRAVGEPYVGTRLAIKKVVDMAAVLSRLKHASGSVESGSISSSNPQQTSRSINKMSCQLKTQHLNCGFSDAMYHSMKLYECSHCYRLALLGKEWQMCGARQSNIL